MKIHHLALLTQDPERLARFYEGLFGLPRITTHHADGRVRSVWLQLEGAILMIERSETGGNHGAGWHLLALQIQPSERAELMQRCSAAGALVETETDYTFYVRDPDGNRIGLSHYPAKPITLRT